MREGPILFNGEMVRAVLDDRKTKTRRVVKPQPADDVKQVVSNGGGRFFPYPSKTGILSISCDDKYPALTCPYGDPGDRLWVRETWKTAVSLDPHSPKTIADHCLEAHYLQPWAPMLYVADGEMDNADNLTMSSFGGKFGKSRPSIHMPRWASRILLEVVSVKVERVNEISEEGAKAEGFYCSGWEPSFYDPDNAGMHESIPAVGNFAATWDDIYKAQGYGWDSNPWVWVVEFKRIEA